MLAEHAGPKRKCLYVLETEHPLRFLNGGRALASVLKDARLAADFRAKYGNQYRTVREYFRPRQEVVAVQDVSNWLPGLVGVAADVGEPAP